MPWKKTSDGKGIELGADGNPIFVYPETNEEAEVKFEETLKKIRELNAESKSHRLKSAELEKQLTELNGKYGSIDIEKAIEAMNTVKALDKGDLMTASKVREFEEKLRSEIGRGYESQISDLKKSFEENAAKFQHEINRREYEINSSVLERHFQESIVSGAIGKKTTLQHIRAATGYFREKVDGGFVDKFRIENVNGKRQPIGYHWGSDKPIMSPKPEKSGEPATFEEAIQVLLQTDPGYDRIAKSLPGGTGSTGGTGRGSAGEISTKEFFDEVFNKR